VRKVFNSLGSLLSVAALIVLVIALAFIFRSQGEEKIAWQPPTASTPVPSIENIRMSDSPGGPAVINFPSRANSVYLIFEYAQVQDTPIAVRTYDSVGNVLFEQAKKYSGSGVGTIGVVSKAGVFADGRYITNIYVGPELFVVKTLMWAVGEELPTPTPTARPTTIPAPTVVPPTPAIPVSPVAMETYISKTLIVANVGDGPGEMGIFVAPEVRPVVPTAIALDGEGNIYIFDAVNQRVVKYDSEGNFISSIVPNPPIGSAKDMCVGDSGAMYLLEGGGLFVRQYNQKGELVLEYARPDWVGYFRSISLDNEGNLLAQVAELGFAAQDVHAILGGARRIVAVLGNSREVFGREQQLGASRPGILLGGNTWVGGYGRSDDGKEMLIFDERGTSILRLPIPDTGAVTLDAWADKGGNLYFVMSMLRLSEIPDEMYKFDPRGNLLAHFPVPAPYYAYPERRFVVDDVGNIYHLLPLRDEVQVIKWEKQ
jgi:hypothetical protein